VEFIGYASFAGLDQPFYQPFGTFARLGYPSELIRPLLTGAGVRDWGLSAEKEALCPYGAQAELLPFSGDLARPIHLWKFRTSLGKVGSFSGPREQTDPQWWGWMRWISERYSVPFRITYSSLATHNHFAIERGQFVFNNKAPVLKLRGTASEDAYVSVLAVLNSSVACFWMKQIFQSRGATAANKNHPDPERFAYEIAGTGLQMLPIPDLGAHREVLLDLGRRIDAMARKRTSFLSTSAWVQRATSVAGLRSAFAERWRGHDDVRQRMIFLQEEIDWLVYFLFGLTTRPLVSHLSSGRIARGQRAFERVGGHRSFVIERGQPVSAKDAECDTCENDVMPELQEVTDTRELEIRNNKTVAAVECYLFKRLWRDTELNIRECDFREKLDAEQMEKWLLNRIEQAAAMRDASFTLSRVAADLMPDKQFAIVAEYYSGSASFNLDVLISDLVQRESVPNHPTHVYTESGLTKRAAWEAIWEHQRRQDVGEGPGDVSNPPEYSQGGRRGKSTDFLCTDYWHLRGKLDVPKER